MEPTRDDTIAGLKALIAFLEANPEFDLERKLSIGWYAPPKSALIALAAHPPLVKDYTDHCFVLSRSFGPVAYKLWVTREVVCRQVEKKITRTVAATPGLPERILPAEAARPERTEEIVVKEWVCDEPLLKPEPVATHLIDAPPVSIPL